VALFGRGDRPERRGTPADVLVIGLGNPGKEYEGTRHNLGVEVIEELARRHGGHLRRSKERSLTTEVVIGGQRVALAFPQTYVNESGQAASLLARRYGIERPEQIVVVHDELDLPPGTLKVKDGGGLAGHNGLRSLKQHLKTDAFRRVRIGVGKPPGGKERGADHVLRKPSKAERTEMDVTVQLATDAVELIVTDGVAAAMTRYNATS
jgi:PTH1 family peptidyl-tRNA hydrolase